jgi:DMSO/TMAO reductase YedYZ molybdopterin-dependent catalytic subunit
MVAEYHLIRFSGRTASAAFVAALSRFLDSPRGSDYMRPPEPAEVWIDARVLIAWVDVYLNGGALAAAQSAFAPVPVAGAVPGVLLAEGSVLIIGGGRSPAWGMAEAERRLEATLG